MNDQKSSIVYVDGTEIEIETITKANVRHQNNSNNSIFDNAVVQLFSAVFGIILVLSCLAIVNNLIHKIAQVITL